MEQVRRNGPEEGEARLRAVPARGTLGHPLAHPIEPTALVEINIVAIAHHQCNVRPFGVVLPLGQPRILLYGRGDRTLRPVRQVATSVRCDLAHPDRLAIMHCARGLCLEGVSDDAKGVIIAVDGGRSGPRVGRSNPLHQGVLRREGNAAIVEEKVEKPFLHHKVDQARVGLARDVGENRVLVHVQTRVHLGHCSGLVGVRVKDKGRR
mmetsp:Transcript_29716/g.77951  ORF Transcript_29716/g.77951 Transcript_29716/m.77951 type:complete len:208 (-) Transcript_29716:245-868(-)